MSDRPAQRDLPIGFELLSDLRLLVYLFVGFRLILAMVYQPYVFDVFEQHTDDITGEVTYTPTTIERGMSHFGDLRYYYQFAELVEDGHLPYRDYWHEFPPVWITLFTGVYGLINLRGAVDFTAWASAIGLIMLVFDVGNLYLLRRLGRRLHGEEVAVALPWVYAVLAAPVIFPWWTFETMVVFVLLLALTWLLEGRDNQSAALTALGTLTKYTPILILPAVWRFYDRRRAIQYTVITLVLIALVLGPLVAWGGRMAMASLLSQFNKASYQSVWALLDGNMRTGSFTGPDTRFDADNAFKPYGNEPAIPSWLRILPFAGLGLFVFARPLRQDDQGVVAFFSITVAIFFLWAHGWSPQWILTLSPLILLNFPTRDGVLVCVVLGLLSFVEYPVLFMRTGDSGGEISGPLVLPYLFTVLTRTALLGGVVVALYQRLTRDLASAAEDTQNTETGAAHETV
ncbi:MAG: hypothetical protein GYB65_00885 [Chloroflexi bacterium]|nr:hypothetical protein [Chloroflexota bacterium]